MHRTTPLLAWLAILPACSTSRVESGVVISPRTTARLDAIGSNPEISIRNTGDTPLPIEIG